VIPWDPATHSLDAGAIEGVEAVINLAGENVAAGRWTAAKCERILRSRVEATSTLVTAFGRMRVKPKVLLNASAVGFYGDRDDEMLTETSPIGHGLLPEVCLAWETHAEQASRFGVRVALLRFGIVLGRDGGGLDKMLPLFRLGLGGRLGRGEQWMSWIARDDVLGVVQQAMTDTRYAGPLNIVAPDPITNADFTAALAHVLRRPALLPVPAWVLRLAFGKMADEGLLASARAIPKKLQELGYRFRWPTIEGALESILR
jgi:uncharacterized protein (TIGR01777 family)